MCGDELEAPPGPAPDGAASLERFLEMSIDLLAIVDLDTRIVEASASWERTLGWRADELVGTIFLELFHPEDLERVLVELDRVLRGEDAVSVVVRMRGKDGEYRWVQGNARSDLAAGRIFVTGADITARKALEDALRHQVALEELVAATAARLIGADPDGVPGAILEGLGQLGDALGADCAHFVRGSRHEDDRTAVTWVRPGADVASPTPEVEASWRSRLAAGSGAVVQVVVDEADEHGGPGDQRQDRAALDRDRSSLLVVSLPQHGRFWGLLAIEAAHEAARFTEDLGSLLRLAGEGFLAALAELDSAVALADARRELEQRNDELEERNEELERFAYAAAHDLKAPLARVEMALASAEVRDDVADQLLEVARRGATRMRQLIEDLLKFATVGRGVGPPGPVELDEVVEVVLHDLAPTIEASHAEVLTGDLPVVQGHPAMLGQLMQNLIANALKFTRPEGRPVVRIDSRVDGDGTTVTVADNGIGIPPDERHAVFGVFVRLEGDDHFQGSGIGLATCAKVVHQLGGRIWIDDGIDGGTAVSFWLPK